MGLCRPLACCVTAILGVAACGDTDTHRITIEDGLLDSGRSDAIVPGAQDASESGTESGTPRPSEGGGAEGGGADAHVFRETCGAPPPSPPSCESLADDCGSSGSEDCCTTLCVPGSEFVLGRGTGDPDDVVFQCDPTRQGSVCSFEVPGIPARISAFWLDRFEVTVGRFRAFVDAVISGWRPQARSGRHGYLNGGDEPGWDSAWPIPETRAEWEEQLLSCAPGGNWTPSPGPAENLPILCMTWYAAQAFCIWDGGFLPTDAEWELAASGGEERVFPWSEPPDNTLKDATHMCPFPDPCNALESVGSYPGGDGRWGHADLAGSVQEWALDGWGVRAGTCNDCMWLSTEDGRNVRAGTWADGALAQRAVARYNAREDEAWGGRGLRCARPL